MSSSRDELSNKTVNALFGCRLFRPQVFAGNVEIAIASPTRRKFSPRFATSLGLCLKQGESHNIISNGQKLVYPANTLCLRFPGNVWSSEESCSGFISIDISPEYLDFDIPEEQMRFITESYPDLTKIAACLELDRPRLIQETVLFELIEWLSKQIPSAAKQRKTIPLKSSVIIKIRRYLEDTHFANPSLDELSKFIKQNKFTLLRQFKRVTGITPHHYIINFRVSKAREMLARGSSASEVATAVGFSDQAHLNRHFLRIVGVTPAQYARERPFVLLKEKPFL